MASCGKSMKKKRLAQSHTVPSMDTTTLLTHIKHTVTETAMDNVEKVGLVPHPRPAQPYAADSMLSPGTSSVLPGTSFGINTRTELEGPSPSSDCSLSSSDGNKSESPASLEQQWLAEAIQEHAVSLVSELPFDESEFSDVLIPECLTEDESLHIRKQSDRKNKLRLLLCLLSGRDFKVLKQFLTHAKRFNEALVEEVWETYEAKRKSSSVISQICILCSIKDSVKVHYVIDYLYSKKIISKKLLEKVALESNAEDCLWDELYEICLGHTDKIAAFRFLAEALEIKGHYIYLSVKLRKTEPIDQTCMCTKPPSDQQACFVETVLVDNADSPYTSLSVSSSELFGEGIAKEDDRVEIQNHAVVEHSSDKIRTWRSEEKKSRYDHKGEVVKLDDQEHSYYLQKNGEQKKGRQNITCSNSAPSSLETDFDISAESDKNNDSEGIKTSTSSSDPRTTYTCHKGTPRTYWCTVLPKERMKGEKVHSKSTSLKTIRQHTKEMVDKTTQTSDHCSRGQNLFSNIFTVHHFFCIAFIILLHILRLDLCDHC